MSCKRSDNYSTILCTIYIRFGRRVWTSWQQKQRTYWAKNWNKSKNYNFGLHFGVLLRVLLAYTVTAV